MDSGNLGRGRGGGGTCQNQQQGRGGGKTDQQQQAIRPTVHQAWSNRPQYGPRQDAVLSSGRGAGGVWSGRPWGPAPPSPSVPRAQSTPETHSLGRDCQIESLSMDSGNLGRGGGGNTDQQQAWNNRPRYGPRQDAVLSSGRGAGGVWSGRPWGPAPPSSSVPRAQSPSPSVPRAQSTPDNLEISEQPRLLVNHFPISYNSENTIFQYDVNITTSHENPHGKKRLPKSELHLIRDKWFSDSQLPILHTTCDARFIFSIVLLPTGEFKVDLSDGEDKSRSYELTINLVNQLKLSKLEDYLNGKLSCMPYDVLKGMNTVMKGNPFRSRISVGQGYYSYEAREGDDLRCGVAAHRGFKQSVKLTSQGPVLCLDYSVLAFRKPLAVIEFLKEHLEGFRELNDVIRLRQEVILVLKGLKVRVTHRVTKQKYSISGLTTENAREISFSLGGQEGKPTEKIRLVDYFKNKWGNDKYYKDIPCLDLSNGNGPNYVPMEFCFLVEGQHYPNKYLRGQAVSNFRRISRLHPVERKNTICQMVQAEDGPCGEVMQNLGVGIDRKMTSVLGRVIGAPDLKIGNHQVVKVDKEKCKWNLFGKSLAEAKPVKQWALIDFSNGGLHVGEFIKNLKLGSRKLGMFMDNPLLCHFTGMHEFSTVREIENLLSSVKDWINEGKLQIIICVMRNIHRGYNYLKWVSEIKMGVVTQCCLMLPANKGDYRFFESLCLKINVKLGGSNTELIERLPNFKDEDHVMFIGADVNHPDVGNLSCPSIAAVVGTMKWPAAYLYTGRVCPQESCKEKIVNFGSMCLDLVKSYARLNCVFPNKIVIFRDGVGEEQFGMVLNEVLDLEKAINDGCHYNPNITLVVAQKRHTTRLFLENEQDGVASGNVPPGTVVDSTIVNPSKFNFYLFSHYGAFGTSNPTHYFVLRNDNCFTSDGIQKLIHHMCFTFARCTNPVSLVPPVYYAHLLAFRGRVYQEVVKEFQPNGSFDQSFYNTHPDLQDVMFFV